MAVSAFYSDRNCPIQDMERQCNWHDLTPLRVVWQTACRLAAPSPSSEGPDIVSHIWRKKSNIFATRKKPRERGLDNNPSVAYNRNRKGAATSGLPFARSGYQFRNRHLPEWRFLLFTLIVIVQFRTWNVNVIGMTSPPSGWCGKPPAVSQRPAPRRRGQE